ncbi:MAG: site-2 protease family protein [Candidatus Binataceae bacterium]
MDELSANKGSPVLTEIPRHAQSSAAPTRGLALPRTRFPAVNIALFLVTMLTTTMAGAYAAGATLSMDQPLASLLNLASGLSFSIPLMLILFSHEMGHYLVAMRHGVDASPPYFIPAPYPSIFFIGTFGAFIRIRSRPPSRRVIFDIGAAGPWAGVIVAVAAVIIGLGRSTIGPLGPSAGGFELGNSIIFYWLSRWILRVDPNSVAIVLHPIALAGWLGLFVTALNLLPVGQLDGGHTIYALFGGRTHRLISRVFVLGGAITVGGSIVLGLGFWGGWLLWAALLIMLGLGHPATTDSITPLDARRRIQAWMTIALFVVTFSPVPLKYTPPAQPENEEKAVEVIFHESSMGCCSREWLSTKVGGDVPAATTKRRSMPDR